MQRAAPPTWPNFHLATCGTTSYLSLQAMLSGSDWSWQPTIRLAVLAAIIAVSVPLAFSGGLLLPSQVRIKGVVVPICLTNQPMTVATLRIDTVARGHQRRGFFRIGPLPAVIGAGVRFEIQQADHFREALAEADRVIRTTTGGHGAELRQVCLVLPGQLAPCLEARRVALVSRDRWDLTDGVVIRAGSDEVRFRRAQLQVSGAETGRLVGETEGARCILDFVAAVTLTNTTKYTGEAP